MTEWICLDSSERVDFNTTLFYCIFFFDNAFSHCLYRVYPLPLCSWGPVGNIFLVSDRKIMYMMMMRNRKTFTKIEKPMPRYQSIWCWGRYLLFMFWSIFFFVIPKSLWNPLLYYSLTVASRQNKCIGQMSTSPALNLMIPWYFWY